MSSNLLTGSIPATLRKMAGLRVLALDQNASTGSFPVWLTSPALETLSLSSNLLSGELNVSGFKNLRVLVVSNNLLSRKLPSAISSLQNLQVLSLAHNRFTGAVPRLEELRNLTSLNLGGNALGPGFPALGTQIVSVFMGQNRFSGPLPSSFRGLLQALDVSGNAMVGTPPPFLFNLPRIASLNLARNHFSGDLPGNLTLSKALSSVDVSGNFFSGRPSRVLLNLVPSFLRPPLVTMPNFCNSS